MPLRRIEQINYCLFFPSFFLLWVDFACWWGSVSDNTKEFLVPIRILLPLRIFFFFVSDFWNCSSYLCALGPDIGICVLTMLK